ncbi:uncharacterized protein LOC129233873 [Uloborus diversus]|uniref:uncharacterized protein LOC129233873 n=1 Tax=Uloborus diversus TaxID=327109 RepID=UPI00240957E1|nr:uncharacterized protein LOC129233873 [Uloborus diversus]
MCTPTSYRKFFICEIFNSISLDVVHKSETSKCLMKIQVLGVIVSIRKFSQRTIYTIDDGSAKIDCASWHKEPTVIEKIKDLEKKVQNDNQELSEEAKEFSHLLLNKVERTESLPRENYTHGDVLICLGIVKAVRGKLLIDIHHHYKVVDVDAETMWTYDILLARKLTKPS